MYKEYISGYEKKEFEKGCGKPMLVVAKNVQV